MTVPPHSLSINDVTQNEGNSGTSTFTFTVTLSNPPSGNFSLMVNFATANGTATGGSSCVAGVDYITTSGQLTFNRNNLTRTISVSVCGDTAFEPDETFFVDLSNPTHDAVLTKSRGVGTIRNDDVAVRSTSTTVDCPGSTAANSPATCTVTVRDTAAGTPSAPLGTVDFDFTAQPAGSSPLVAPDPCTLAPADASSSTCTVTFTANTVGSYTIRGTYLPTSAHTSSTGSDTILVTARTTSTTVDCPPSTPANTPANCTVTVTDIDGGTKSAPQGTVDLEITAKPTGSTSTALPDPCPLLTASASSSSCTFVFTGDTVGAYTIKGTYQPAAGSAHATSSGTDTIQVTARTTSTTISCPASTQAGTPASCTVTVADTDTPPKSPPNGSVDFVVTAQPSGSSPVVAPDPCPLAPAGGDSSTCAFTFSSTRAGNYTIEGTYEPAPTAIHRTSDDTATITVTAGPPAEISLSPAAATNPVNSEHCVTATVTDEFGNPNAGVVVRFTVTGANPRSGSATTNGSGEAKFCYTGVLAGPDVIRAFADTNNNETREPSEPEGAATKAWTAPPSTPLCQVEFTTLGVQIVASNGDHGTGGGNVHVSDAGVASGEQEYQDHGPAEPMNVHASEILAVVCIASGSGGKQATIYFTGTVDGEGPRAGRVEVEDNGDPGTNDTYWILVSKLTGVYDSGKQPLTGGNVQIH